MRSQAVIIGDNYLAASTFVRPSTNNVVLLEWEGWDTAPEFERKSNKRLFGSGDVYSRLTDFGAKTFSFHCFVEVPDTTNIRIVRTQLMTIAERLNDRTTVKMQYFELGGIAFTEEIKALPASPFIDEWQPVNNGVEFTMNFYAPDPYKTVYLNGSSTPEVTKRL